MNRKEIVMSDMTYEHEDAQTCGPCCAMAGEFDSAVAECAGPKGERVWLRVTDEPGMGATYQVVRGEKDFPPDEEYTSVEEMKRSRFAEGLDRLEKFLREQMAARK